MYTKKCLSITVPIAVGLQAPENRIMDCERLVADVLLVFKEMRDEKPNEQFGEILVDVEQLCELSGRRTFLMKIQVFDRKDSIYI